MVRYQFKLEGYDEEWSPVTEKSFASYDKIGEGHYTFKLKASNPDGVWSEPIEYGFKVNPPFWRTWWAYTLYVLVFVTSVYAFIHWRLKNLKQEKIELEEKVRSRTVELELKSDELEKAFGSLKATQAQLIQSEKMASLGSLPQASPTKYKIH